MNADGWPLEQTINWGPVPFRESGRIEKFMIGRGTDVGHRGESYVAIRIDKHIWSR